MSNRKYWALTAGLGCATLILMVAVVVIPLVIVPLQIRTALSAAGQPAAAAVPAPVATLFPAASDTGDEAASLADLYRQLNPGIVSIEVVMRSGGGLAREGAGSGFVYDDQGHIVTNNHVVESASQVTVVTYDGVQVGATVVGRDPDSDLAVIKVDSIPAGLRTLALGDSSQVAVGETVIAIGNPFGLGNSMTAGIVSAVGRTIESGTTPFSIPQAIQTDAAINPGNSGGPLLNLRGQVVGVNAQIATNGSQANAGVGFAIPSNIVRQVVPVLIEKGTYQWPWLGVSGSSISLALMQANGLDSQQGAYVDEVTPGGPAAEAGLQGSSQTKVVGGARVPAGGDVILAIDGKPVAGFDALLVEIAARKPGDQAALTVLRGGQRREVTVTLTPRSSRQQSDTIDSSPWSP